MNTWVVIYRGQDASRARPVFASTDLDLISAVRQEIAKRLSGDPAPRPQPPAERAGQRENQRA